MAASIDAGFVVHDGLAEEWLDSNTLVISGRIECQHGLFVEVKKFLAVENLASGERQAQTVKYTYHAGVSGKQDRGIFQYDNYHAYRREGHADEHHKHVWDPATWRKQSPPEWIGRDRWPHLSDVIDELQDWWYATGQHLNLHGDSGSALIDQDPG